MPATARSARPAAPARRPIPARVVTARPQPGPRQALVSILGLVAFVVALVVAAIVINTQSAVLAYEIHDAQIALAKARQDNAELQARLDKAASPAQLRQVAEKEGMVPAGATGYLTLASKRIDGGVAASEPPKPTTPTPAVSEKTPAPTKDQ